MDPCRGGRFVPEHREDTCRHQQPRAASAEGQPCSCRAPKLCPPRAAQQCHCHPCTAMSLSPLHSNVTVTAATTATTCHTTPPSCCPRGPPGWHPSEQALLPQAAQTARGFPAQGLPCPQPCSCPSSALKLAVAQGVGSGHSCLRLH